MFFSSLLAADERTFQELTREDHWVENLTAVYFFLAGLLLFVTTLAERSSFRRCVYILGGMAMVFAAGEEISWGQRIFGFATPDFARHTNQQQEFNVHNVANGLFDIIWLNGTLVLCMATSAAFFCRKDRLFGIPLPSIPLMLGFLLILYYTSGANLEEFSGENFGEYVTSVRRTFGFIVVEKKGLLSLFFIFALFSRQVELVIASAATLALVLALALVNYLGTSIGSPNELGAGLFEVREYLFGLGCLFYCLETLPAQGRFAAVSRAPFARLKLPGRRIPFLMMTCYLVIAGSIGLIFLAVFAANARTAAIEEALWSVTADEPAARSNFDIYLRENALYYLKSPCSAADAQAPFFLHVHPKDARDLPADRRQHNFDNLDFHFDQFAALASGDRCMALRPLPDYPIARIRTGQFTADDGEIWEAEFHVGAGEDGPLPSTDVPPPSPGTRGSPR